MDYNLEIQRLLLKKEQAPLPDDKINIIKQAIILADSHNDLQWGFDLRVDLIDEESNTSRNFESFPAFAWMLDVYDSDPEMFDVTYLLGKYRWMISEAYRNVNISLAQIQQMLVDFKIRLQENGFSLRTFYSASADLGFFLSKDDMVEENLQLRNESDVNQMFDYWLGELYANIENALRKNNFEFAIQMEREISIDKLQYLNYPLAIYSSFIRHLTRNRKYKQAYMYFLKAEECLPALSNDQSIVNPISKMIHFLSVYDKEKAWQYFEKYVNYTINCEDCTAAFFAMDVLSLLKNTKGIKVLNVSPQIEWYRADNTYKVADLHNYYYNMAHNLAARFDERNGNKSFTTHLKRTQNLETNWLSRIWNKIKR